MQPRWIPANTVIHINVQIYTSVLYRDIR